MQELQTIKILVADGRSVVASGVVKVLEGIPGFQVVGQAGNADETFRLFERFSPDVVSIDIDLPGPISGLEIIRRLRRRTPGTHILILTNLLEEAIVHDALREGVLSYLLKNATAEELVHAIRAAFQGIPTLSPEVTRILIRDVSEHHRYHLTSREHQVLELLSKGLNNNQIAQQLSISLSTVQFHVSNILDKLGVHNRIEAAAFAIRHKLAS